MVHTEIGVQFNEILTPEKIREMSDVIHRLLVNKLKVRVSLMPELTLHSNLLFTGMIACCFAKRYDVDTKKHLDAETYALFLQEFVSQAGRTRGIVMLLEEKEDRAVPCFG